MLFNFANSETLDSNSGAIPEARSSVPVTWRHNIQIVVVQRLVVRANSSRFILGWICATFAIPLLGLHSISGITETIPYSGYISPEVMVTCLSMLTSLEELKLQFHSPQSFPDQESRPPPPPTRSVLPALKTFWFKGVNEYLEELVARIDTPRIDRLLTTFFNDINFNTPELNQFISRTLTLGAYDEA
ncbi:hypothetical protein V8E52_000188, partial [Russula decolorans]